MARLKRKYVYKWKTDKINEFDFGMVKLVRTAVSPITISKCKYQG